MSNSSSKGTFFFFFSNDWLVLFLFSILITIIFSASGRVTEFDCYSVLIAGFRDFNLLAGLLVIDQFFMKDF